MADAQGGLGGLGGYVGNLYSDLYGRQASPDEVNYWANSGQDPSKILDSFLGSQEYRQTAIPTMYQDFLGRAPDQAGLNSYLNSGQSLNDIASALMNSDEAKVYQASDSSSTSPPPFPPANPPLPPQKPDWLAPFDFGGATTPADMIGKWYQHFGGQYGPGAAGGNFAVESYLNPLQQQMSAGGTPYLDANGNPKGFGLGQLGGLRLNGPDPNNGSMGLNDFAKAYGFDPNTTDPTQATELQLRHQLYEMQDGWLKNQNILDKLKGAKSLSDAIGIFGGPTGYERPKDPVVPGTDNFTERLRDGEIMQQYYNGGLNSLTPDQRNMLMNWQSRTSPIPQVNPSIDNQQFGPNIDMSKIDVPPTPGFNTANFDISSMPSNLPTDASTALLQNANLTGNPTFMSPPMVDPSQSYQWSTPYNGMSFSSGGAQPPGAANPFPGGVGGSNLPYLSPGLYPQFNLPDMNFSTPTFNDGGFTGVGV